MKTILDFPARSQSAARPCMAVARPPRRCARMVRTGSLAGLGDLPVDPTRVCQAVFQSRVHVRRGCAARSALPAAGHHHRGGPRILARRRRLRIGIVCRRLADHRASPVDRRVPSFARAGTAGMPGDAGSPDWLASAPERSTELASSHRRNPLNRRRMHPRFRLRPRRSENCPGPA